MYTVNNNPWKSGTKFLLLAVIILSLLAHLFSFFTSFECKQKKYKIIKTDTCNVISVWYIDTFQVKNDTLIYYNSDSSKVVIPQPFKIKNND